VFDIPETMPEQALDLVSEDQNHCCIIL
jgi:hypothetical protein